MTSTPTKTYVHPPITEAVIEIRFSPELGQDEREKIVKRLNKDYPHLQELNAVDINIGLNQTAGDVTINQQQKGFRLTSDDQADIVMVLPHALAVARLAPYPGWDALYARFVSVWKIWKRFAKTRVPSRIGVRYINRIDIPLEGSKKIELEDYLAFYPKVPEFSKEPMEHYLVQITQPTHNPLWSTTITSTSLRSPLINKGSLLLDIDVFRTQDIPIKAEELVAMLVEARDIKNAVFRHCITPQTERLFE